MKEKSIYILISQTQTRFAKCIRKIGRQQYNHAAISLDSEFREVYAFARPRHKAVLLGRLVRESLERYTLGSDSSVPVVVFRIAVSEGEYEWTVTAIHRILNDPEYMYNLFSVLTYPFFGGFETYKAFTCIEFVAYILKHMGMTDKPCCKYKPDELLTQLQSKIIFKGDIRECMVASGNMSYFAPMNRELYIESAKALGILLKRTCSNRRISNSVN